VLIYKSKELSQNKLVLFIDDMSPADGDVAQQHLCKEDYQQS